MHIIRFPGSILLGLAFSSALAAPLNASKFSPTYIGFSADNARACLVGQSFDPEWGNSTAELTLLDLKRDAVLAKTQIPVPDDDASLYPVQCAFDGENVYLLANVDTQASRSLNQGLVYIYQFNMQGKQLGKKELAIPGSNSYGHALGVSASGLQVAGYIKDEDDSSEYYSFFTLALDRRLKEGKLNVRKTGAFRSGSEARFVGDNVQVAGPFVAAKVVKDNWVDDYANSRVLVNGGYAWSMRPFKQSPRHVAAGISQQGAIYSLAYEKTGSTLAVTSAEGKQLSLASYPSKFCETSSITEYGADVLALRKPCDVKRKAAELVLISPANGKETPLQLAPGEPVFAATNSGQWVVISKDAGGKLAWYTGAVGGETRFSQTTAGVEHSLSLGRINIDKKGQRSFDFAYEQRAGECRFSMNGHAVQVDIFNPEGDDGKELPQVVMYDSEGIALTLPLDGPPRQASFTGTLAPEQAKRSCGNKNGGKVSLTFSAAGARR
ncbi:hypothetical protein [Duganella sp. Root198D2]|uniref:hypothetical protein n=1 Tax=Duganella sp. Root198D2 TaxID=1736489 RepID=UPI00070DFDA1|nr:hypothetical protein [Duganella sp. Root198D2]KRB83572.1 hypothetical protein ASE26_10365 [Duganella sp. Root198D2]